MDESHELHADLSEYFALQLSEIELLSSMYPDANELNITLPSVLTDMKLYNGGKRNVLPLELDFTLNLDVPEHNTKLELCVALPHEYPWLKPHVTARSSGLNRHQQKELNDALYEYIKSLDDGELCVLSLITWLSENAQNYFSLQSDNNKVENASQIDDDSCKDTLCRLWIYSHHIYSKFKRRDILDIAQDLKLTGFSLPGKPGFICVEGIKIDCDEFHQQLKKMSWKKLSLVKEEIVESESNLQAFRKFPDFQEISFQVRRGPAKEYHMDMGQFLKYLEDHNCTYAFQDLFGIEGHISNNK